MSETLDDKSRGAFGGEEGTMDNFNNVWMEINN